MKRIIIIILLLVVTFSRISVAKANQSNYFFNSINAIRAQQGLSSLSYYGPLNNVAQNWVTYMSTNNRLIHNMNLPYEVSGWRYLGENVGYANSIPQLEHALEQSPEHYVNMVRSDYTLVGIAVAQSSDGRYWVAEDFMTPATPTVMPPPIQRPIKRSIVEPKPVVNTITTNANISATTSSTTLPRLDIPQAPIVELNHDTFLQIFFQLIRSDGIPMHWN